MKESRLCRAVVPLVIASCCCLIVHADEPWKQRKASLMTQWAKDVTPESALAEYPRPQMVRKEWQNLNGLWEYAFTEEAAAIPAAYAGKILVPFPMESALSGVMSPADATKRLWCRRVFTMPPIAKGQRVLLHFGAVNWDASVTVNGQKIGTHRGGYTGFSFDITEQLRAGSNELIVSAWNPVRADIPDAQVLGKQRLHPGGIFYTPATGIWQTVWLETVSAAHIENLKLTPDVDNQTLHVHVRSSAPGQVKIVAMKGEQPIAVLNGATGADLALLIANPILWSPENPYLYNLSVSLMQGDRTVDSVNSYFAMRKVSLGKDEQGRTRTMLNNRFVFQVGALDQGYWPDGIYTAPNDDALRYDVEIAKKLGFNLLRKHAKVEPDRWYFWTDKLGILVWQDMPQMFGGKDDALSDDAKKQFEIEWREEIAEFFNHPSIIVWTTFNEGWGQHDTEAIVALTKQLDPTRLVNNASGWTDKKVGDLRDTHAYPGPWSEKPEPTRAAVCGEFGGVTMSVESHRWNLDTFGYGAVLKDARLVTKRYQALLRAAYRLRDEQGTSAFVYTQLTDVEQEINGLLTYDRAIVKPDATVAAAANQGKFLPLPPDPNPPIVPTAQDEPQKWRFTTDKPADDWMKKTFDDASWKIGESGFGHEAGSIHTEWTTADIWLRREVTLPASLPVSLAFDVFHDEDVEIYLNGVLAGGAKGFNTEYQAIPMTDEGRAALKPGENVMAVHCHQTVGGQFIDVGIVKATQEPRPLGHAK